MSYLSNEIIVALEGIRLTLPVDIGDNLNSTMKTIGCTGCEGGATGGCIPCMGSCSGDCSGSCFGSCTSNNVGERPSER